MRQVDRFGLQRHLWRDYGLGCLYGWSFDFTGRIQHGRVFYFRILDHRMLYRRIDNFSRLADVDVFVDSWVLRLERLLVNLRLADVGFLWIEIANGCTEVRVGQRVPTTLQQHFGVSL